MAGGTQGRCVALSPLAAWPENATGSAQRKAEPGVGPRLFPRRCLRELMWALELSARIVEGDQRLPGGLGLQGVDPEGHICRRGGRDAQQILVITRDQILPVFVAGQEDEGKLLPIRALLQKLDEDVDLALHWSPV